MCERALTPSITNGELTEIYGAGAINIDKSRSNFPFSLHRNLPEKHSSSNMLYQYVKPWALFRYGTTVHWQPRRSVEKETKKRRIGARSNLRTIGKASVYLDNYKEGNIDLCSSNSLSKYHLFLILGVEILLPLKSLCENVYGASAVKKDGWQELGKQQNVVQILLPTTGVGQRCLDGEEPAWSTGASHMCRRNHSRRNQEIQEGGALQ